MPQEYGVVPQTIFPESWTSSNTGRVNQLITAKLREHALLLRASAESLRASLIHLSKEQRDNEVVASLRRQKEVYIGEIYKILTIAQGEPPKPSDKFTWEYYTAKGEYKKWTGTPIEFYKVRKSSIDDTGN
jgi:bleomycin hydrolase